MAEHAPVKFTGIVRRCLYYNDLGRSARCVLGSTKPPQAGPVHMETDEPGVYVSELVAGQWVTDPSSTRRKIHGPGRVVFR